MTDNSKRRALEALIERAAANLNLSEEESKALIAPISEQFKRLEADNWITECVFALAHARIRKQPKDLLWLCSFGFDRRLCIDHLPEHRWWIPLMSGRCDWIEPLKCRFASLGLQLRNYTNQSNVNHLNYSAWWISGPTPSGWLRDEWWLIQWGAELKI